MNHEQITQALKLAKAAGKIGNADFNDIKSWAGTLLCQDRKDVWTRETIDDERNKGIYYKDAYTLHSLAGYEKAFLKEKKVVSPLLRERIEAFLAKWTPVAKLYQECKALVVPQKEMKPKKETYPNHPIRKCLKPLRDRAAIRASEEVDALVERIYAKLAEHGWDLNLVAPFPSSSMRRVDYMTARNRYDLFRSVTRSTGDCCRRPGDPDIREPYPQGVEGLRERSVAQAVSVFDSYVLKLIIKVGEVKKAAISCRHGDYVWSESYLHCITASGKGQTWKTRTIWNTSKFGLAFNQYPTRLVLDVPKDKYEYKFPE